MCGCRWTMRALIDVSIHISIWGVNWIMAYLSFTVIRTTHGTWADDWMTRSFSHDLIAYWVIFYTKSSARLCLSPVVHFINLHQEKRQHNIIYILFVFKQHSLIFPSLFTPINARPSGSLTLKSMQKLIWAQASNHRLLSLHHSIITCSLFYHPQSGGL